MNNNENKKKLQDPELIAIAGQVINWMGFAEYLKRLVKPGRLIQRFSEKRTSKCIRELVKKLEDDTIKARSSLRVIEKCLEPDFPKMPHDIIALNIEDEEFRLYHKAFNDLLQSTSSVYNHTIDLRSELKEYDINQDEKFFKMTQRSEMLRELTATFLDEIMYEDVEAIPKNSIEMFNDDIEGSHTIKQLLQEADNLLGVCQRDIAQFKDWMTN